MTAGRIRIVFSILGVTLLCWLVWQAGLSTILQVVESVEWVWAAAYVPLFFLVACGIALRWRWVLQALGVTVPLPALMSMWFAGVTVSSVTTGAKLGGDPLRAFLLARRPVPTGLAVASVIMDRAIELLANLSFAVLYCTVFATRHQALGERLLLGVVLGGVVFLGAGGWLVRRLGRGDSWAQGRFAQVLDRLGASPETLVDTEDALRLLLFHKRAALGRIVAWALGLNALIFVEFAIAFRVFSAAPTVPELAGAIMGVGLAHSLPIPGSLGALEGAQVAIFSLGGAGAITAVTAAVVVRSRDLFRALPGAVLMALGRIGQAPEVERRQT